MSGEGQLLYVSMLFTCSILITELSQILVAARADCLNMNKPKI